MIGKKFGNLTVEQQDDAVTLFGGVHWQCLCVCGVKRSVSNVDLVSKNVISCGCRVISETGIIESSENKSRKCSTPVYPYNDQMLTAVELQRTTEALKNKLRVNTLRYRLVKLGWSVEKALNTPVNGEPRKAARTFTYNGVTKTITEWSRIYEVDYDLLYTRLFDLGWDFEKTVNTPKVFGTTGKVNYTHNGITKTISEWAKQFNISYATLYNRLFIMKWDFDKAVNTKASRAY